MDERTATGLRDGLLALLAMGGLLPMLRRRDRLDALLSPGAVVAGVGGAVGLEAVLLRHAERTRALWHRRSVRVASLLGTVLAGRELIRRSDPRAVAALCWGLLAYLAMLGGVLAGRPNPVSRLLRTGGGDGRARAGRS
jgi:hypothetical protein